LHAGSLSALANGFREKLIRFSIVKEFCIIAMPFAFVGAVFSYLIDVEILIIGFGLFMLFYGFHILYEILFKTKELWFLEMLGTKKIAVIGATLTGLISIGIGMLLLPQNMKNPKLQKTGFLSSTNLAIVFLTGLTASIVKFALEFQVIYGIDWGFRAPVLVVIIAGSVFGGYLGGKISKGQTKSSIRVVFAIVLILIGITTVFNTIKP